MKINAFLRDTSRNQKELFYPQPTKILLDGIVCWKDHTDLCAKPRDLLAPLPDKDRVFQKDLMVVSFTLTNQPFVKNVRVDLALITPWGCSSAVISTFVFCGQKKLQKK